MTSGEDFVSFQRVMCEEKHRIEKHRKKKKKKRKKERKKERKSENAQRHGHANFSATSLLGSFQTSLFDKNFQI